MKYLIVAILLLTLELVYFKIADKCNIIDKPNLRSSHTHITLRGGGIVFLLGVWVYEAFFGLSYPYFLAGMTMISLISFADDIHSISNRYRLIVQFASMSLMFADFGILNLESWWIVAIALIMCVGITNAYNFMDGINGITGGYSLAVLLPLMYVNSEEQFIDGNLLIVSVISVLVFCFFNFRKRAKCFAGDVGSIGMAFVVIFVLGKLMLATSDIRYILFLSVYGIDSVLTIVHRIMLHENLGEAHRKHAYQLMANELHIPHVLVSVIYMAIQICISAGLLLCGGWSYFVLVLIVLALTYVLFVKKYYCLHVEYLKSKGL